MGGRREPRIGLALAVASWLAAGCGEDTSPALPTAIGSGDAGGGGGAPPIEAGAALTCPPSELALEDGSCLGPGVPPDGCGEGFVHDGEYGCEPLLPPDACDEGRLAVPGDEICRLVHACSSGTWGAIPVDANTVYVDGSYSGVSAGSASQPFTTVQDAVSAAPDGAIVAIAAGTYEESVTVGRSVVIWGVCPSLVTIESPSGAAIDVAETATSVVVRDLGCSGRGRGVHSRG